MIEFIFKIASFYDLYHHMQQNIPKRSINVFIVRLNYFKRFGISDDSYRIKQSEDISSICVTISDYFFKFALNIITYSAAADFSERLYCDDAREWKFLKYAANQSDCFGASDVPRASRVDTRTFGSGSFKSGNR